ncbi:hypothetical protein KIPB_006883, partial [Kipferlia bialata]|eukprot:g6883.t1
MYFACYSCYYRFTYPSPRYGALQSVLPLGFCVFAVVAGKAQENVIVKTLLRTAAVVVTIGMVCISRAVRLSVPATLLSVIMVAAGYGVFLVLNQSFLLTTCPRRYSGTIGALISVANQLARSLGIGGSTLMQDTIQARLERSSNVEMTFERSIARTFVLFSFAPLFSFLAV